MSNGSKTNNDTEIVKFKSMISEPHRRTNPCFMTGKGCVYTEQIDKEIEIQRNQNKYRGFMVHPFKPNISAFHNLCLKRYIQGEYGQDNDIELIRADEINKTGYIICEKICKKIQESDFVIVDVSVPNANVFYELGLAYGIRQKIILIHHAKSQIGSNMGNYFQCKPYQYNDLTPLDVNQFLLSSHIWTPSKKQYTDELLYTLFLETLSCEIQVPEVTKDDISLSFSAHIGASVGVAFANIHTELKSKNNKVKIPDPYLEVIDNNLKSVKFIKPNEPFDSILTQINKSFCTIIKTGGSDCDPLMYFWLGYCHATGKNVIPITVLEGNTNTQDLAFDLRALWHMFFYPNSPEALEKQLEDTLYQMVTSDFVELSRRQFWDKILGKRGKVSIFTGALRNDIGREMVGDWDLRAASELTSYFSSHHYRATIESPVYQIENVFSGDNVISLEQRIEYIDELKKMLSGKNCVIIASPDVNPLTEIVLGKFYGISESDLFQKNEEIMKAHQVIAFKETDEGTRVLNRALYKEKVTTDDIKSRGFDASFLEKLQITGSFVSQDQRAKKFTVHAHLAIIPNIYGSDPKQEQKYIIILNGVSGPATFALTHALTGGVSSEFVDYDPAFDPHQQSESIMEVILANMNSISKEKQMMGAQYIIEVEIGPKSNYSDGLSSGMFDWRHILKWELKAKDVFEGP